MTAKPYLNLVYCLVFTAFPLSVSASFPEDAEAIVQIQPTYPEEALEDCLKGFVEANLEIAIDGSVASVTIVLSEPRGVFDQAAIRGFSMWKFKPKVEDGKAVGFVTRQKLRFKPETSCGKPEDDT